MKRATSLLLAVFLYSCGSDGGAGPDAGFDRADLPLLFASVTEAERAAVLADWASRDVTAREVRILQRDTVTVGIDTVEVRILSHLVQGDRHYGALVIPVNSVVPRPVLAYTHFSDIGVNVESSLFGLGAIAGIRASQFVLVLPSYRGKTLSYGSGSWTSEGDISIWDGEVDDALALIHVAWEQPEVNSTGAATYGFSAGGAIALLTAIREAGVVRVVDFFGPTDFFGPYAQQLLVSILDDTPPDLASIPQLQSSVVDPLERGELSLADMRLELLRRSPLHFADRLPAVLAHHGTADDVVAVDETRALEEAILAAGGMIEAHYYAGGGHSPFGLDGSLGWTASFLGVLSPAGRTAVIPAGRRSPPGGDGQQIELGRLLSHR
ncbi:MAG TPA: hypothetical protein QGF95_02505 [Candidatus Latescibacteria bacterium]|nr:hypothetical protein [Gemmatimonadaceae bacterium]MDP6018132.1 hypothetical protein [Candidatus Latescibacterota bacterium]HJP29406.1 hypothetical protein [Candidatus Latescibacterota bacterium]